MSLLLAPSRRGVVTLEPFRRVHVLELDLPGPVRAEVDRQTDPAAGYALFEITAPWQGIAWTGRVGGLAVASGGLRVIWPGVAHAWALPSVHAARHVIPFHRHFRRMLLQGARDLALRRIEAETPEDFDAGRRWLERLQFHVESRMPRYGPCGETFLKYVWFPGEPA